uniref:Uncharacterized protein n=1 Tax=Piliocolobus tephrosceles TaxID=591936 RepID=A0A8C9LIE8_9PRIM
MVHMAVLSMDRTCEERPAEDGNDEDDPDSIEAPTRIRDTPEDIVLEAPATGLAFHLARDLLAAGDVDGDMFLFSYSCQEGETKELWSLGHHLKACRAVAFSEDGQVPPSTVFCWWMRMFWPLGMTRVVSISGT